MKNLQKLFNNKGLTLIELLVSLALISIVIVTFLGFFSQSVLFSSKAEDKLTALNIAEKVIAELKSDEDLLKDLQKLEDDCKDNSFFLTYLKELKVDFADCKEFPSDLKIHPFSFDQQNLNNKVYYPYVKVSTSENEWDLDLWQVHVKVFTEEGNNYTDPNPVTELLSYLDSEIELGE